MKAGFSASVRKRWGVFCVSQDPCNLEATLQINTVEFRPHGKTVHCTIFALSSTGGSRIKLILGN